MSEGEQKGRCYNEMKVSRDFPTDHFVMAAAIDRLAADVASIKAKIDAVSPEDVRHFVESEKAWVTLVTEQRDAAIRERDEARAKVERLQEEVDDREQTEQVKRLREENEKLHRASLNYIHDRDQYRRERDEARALLELAQVQRTAAYADRDEARAEVYQVKCSRTETSKERDAAIRERDEWREEARLAVVNRDEALADVERLKAGGNQAPDDLGVLQDARGLSERCKELASRIAMQKIESRAEKLLAESSQQQPSAAPQPVAPPAGWLTDDERKVIIWAASELSAIGHHRPPDKEQCLRLSEDLRRLVKRHDAGSPPVVEVPVLGTPDSTTIREKQIALAYRDAMDKAGVKWKEVPRE